MNTTEEKYCPDCDTDKSLSEFYKTKGRESTYSRACKVCVRKREKAKAKKVRSGYYLPNGELNVGMIASPLNVSLCKI